MDIEEDRESEGLLIFCQFTKNIKLTCTFCHIIDYSDVGKS